MQWAANQSGSASFPNQLPPINFPQPHPLLELLRHFRHECRRLHMLIFRLRQDSLASLSRPLMESPHSRRAALRLLCPTFRLGLLQGHQASLRLWHPNHAPRFRKRSGFCCLPTSYYRQLIMIPGGYWILVPHRSVQSWATSMFIFFFSYFIHRFSVFFLVRYGPEAAETSQMLAGTARNAGLVYVDLRGIGRRAILKRAGKQFVKGRFSSNKG